MSRLLFTLVFCLGWSAINDANGQFGDDSSVAAPLPTKTSRWRVGMSVRADGGPCQGLYGTVPVPTDWPGQIVRIVAEDISPDVRKVKYRTLNGGVKQMLISIPTINPGAEAHAIVTFEIERTELPPIDNPDNFQISRRVPRESKLYLGPSPYIESRHAKIRGLAKELTDESLTPWKQVEKFYDHVRDTITYRNGKLKGALAALKDGDGDCEELTSLFIALCRAYGVPARTVWVPGHCYPEFYLEDGDGTGHWIPCQAAGTRAFGTIPELRPILQKGDNFRVPELEDRVRYVSEFLTGSSRRGNGRPVVKFIREELGSGR